MELDSSSLTCLTVLCLLGAAEVSSLENNTCCPDIPKVPRTKRPEVACFQINSTFRYACIDGYVRKSGTSNLLKCKQSNGTSFIYTPSTGATFECILDPKRTTAPPKSTATTGPTHVHIPHESTVSSTVSEFYLIDPKRTTAPPKSTATSKSGPTHVHIPHESTVSSTVSEFYLTSRSLQTSQSIQPSAPLSAEPTSSSTFSSPAPPGSSQGTVDSMPETKASTSHGTLSTTTEASNNGTITPGMLSSTTPRLVIGCASLVIFCALVGISFFFYKRRSKNEIPQQTDEQMPMKMDPRD
ncbi:interleukin-15 receptor subunit alpha isoform X2 [Trematomus bernacchii]|uniref:interleukin-15 receptor subunit alpha isoform X2 n=1 Tax=Trematomus bernacchii TaxID=40690 RepID=UPI00146A03BD|nr:interleukin-15 receptor subunit alpha isoform X2 [Trematomus bernacchii]